MLGLGIGSGISPLCFFVLETWIHLFRIVQRKIFAFVFTIQTGTQKSAILSSVLLYMVISPSLIPRCSVEGGERLSRLVRYALHTFIANTVQH